MKPPLRISVLDDVARSEAVRIVDVNGCVVCRLPRVEIDFANKIVARFNAPPWWAFWRPRTAREHWERERDDIENRYVSPDSNRLKTGGYQPRPLDGPGGSPPITGGGVQRGSTMDALDRLSGKPVPK